MHIITLKILKQLHF